MREPSPLRVVQWTSGNVARQSVRAIVERPDLELVGMYAFTPAKVGLDAGTLAGLDEELGVLATDDVEALLALEPDCVAYMPLYPNIEEMARLLRAGVNIVTTSEFLTGRAHGDEQRARLDAAAREGGASVFGSGVNPGWVQYVAAAASGPVHELEFVRILESFDLSFLTADANQDDFGWGRPAGDADHAADVQRAVYEFEDAADLLASLFGVELDGLRCEVRFAHAAEDLDVPGREVRAGTVAGIEVSWIGGVAGRDVLELATRWVITSRLVEGWTALNGYEIDLRGAAGVKLRVDLVPGPDVRTVDDIVTFGCLVTAMPAINAIPAVVAARPGIVTYADLGPQTARFTSG